ncbi:MAG: hypothetical protein KDK99_04445 [Verrucomicrobiales bacterium]|nr:hypothetical protein [Verrucomicrobiales bacterium]
MSYGTGKAALDFTFAEQALSLAPKEPNAPQQTAGGSIDPSHPNKSSL